LLSSDLMFVRVSALVNMYRTFENIFVRVVKKSQKSCIYCLYSRALSDFIFTL
jgi:hypothetical protein